MNTEAKMTRKESDEAAIKGIDTHLSGETIVLRGTSYESNGLKQVFQDDIDAATSTSDAKTKWKTAVVVERATARDTRLVRAALLAYLIATHGPESNVLLDFGFKPRKGAKTKPRVKADAVDQAKRTRKERHIMGKRQRARIPSATLAKDAQPASAGGATAIVNGEGTTVDVGTPHPGGANGASKPQAGA